MASSAPPPIDAVRRFNRFYTRQIGLLHEGLSGTRFPLAEARVLYELAHRERPTATELARDLGLDPGYLSRILRGFERRKLLRRTRSESDGRQSHLALTALGRRAFAPLNRGSQDEMGAILGGLSPADQARVVDLDEQVELRPTLKTNGFSIPGFHSGWFLLRNRRRTFVAIGNGRRRLWLPGSGRYDLLLEPVDPAALLARLRELAAAHGRG